VPSLTVTQVARRTAVISTLWTKIHISVTRMSLALYPSHKWQG
jgi:hypothetical protein